MINLKKISSSVAISALLLSSAVQVLAAAPDGMGSWADTVVSTSQGLQKDGNPVQAVRSDPTSALGVAENDTVDGHFYSLGFGGKISLGFDNGISSGVIAVEATNHPYPTETAKVEVSTDNISWVTAGNVTEDGSVNVPANLGCVHYVRITDTSDKALYESTADGYDVDGVQAQGNICTTGGKMTGGGSVFKTDNTRVTHGMELYCDFTKKANSNLEINWDKGNKFHLDTLTYALCTDDPAIDQGHPNAGFDTYKGMGTGKFNNKPGYTASWTFVDAGEPGKNDLATIVIKDSSNNVVLTVSGNLKNGNQQAH